MNYQNIPNGLKEAKGWIVWKKVKRDGKYLKLPVKLDGSSDGWNDTNYSFDEVKEYELIGLQPRGKLICIDLDNCFDSEGRPNTAALDALTIKSYTEYSPSGKGLHIWLYTTIDYNSMARKGIEIFANSKYCTITGLKYGAIDTIETHDISWFINKYFNTSSRHTADPLKKKGPIGSFCRAISIDEALEMTGMYTHIEGNRWHYNPSESAPGVLTYEGRWVVSNHATDPLCDGHEHNAFDTVRIHKFGPEDTTNQMLAWAVELPKVQEQIIKDTFSDIPAGLTYTKTGALKKTYENLELCFQNDFEFRFNEFSKEYEIVRAPWVNEPKLLEDADFSLIEVWMGKKYALYGAANMIKNSIISMAHNNTYHPIKQYFENLPTWDGVKRAETLLIDCFGAQDTPYTRAVTFKTLCAAVQRIYSPGIKFDYCLTLIGETGLRKSSLFRILAGNTYFSDDFNLSDTRDKTASEKTLTNWLIEIGELAGMRKADTDCVKSFMTRQYDKFRSAFGRVVETHPRHCVFVATSNETNGILKDTTGGRRWWLVNCFKQWNGIIDRDQIWAEIMATGRDELLYLDDDLERFANKIQAENLETDEAISLIEDYISKKIPPNYYDIPFRNRDYIKLDEPQADWVNRSYVIVKEIWVDLFGKNPYDLTRHESNKIVASLLKLGLTRSDRKRCGIYGKSLTFYIIP